MQTKYLFNLLRDICALSFSAIACLAVLPVAGQTVKPARVVSTGPLGDVVNETAVAAEYVNGELRYMAMWQVQDKPVGQNLEKPIRLEYAIGEVDTQLDRMIWTEMGAVPAPECSQSGDTQIDASVVSIIKFVGGTRFIGSGIALCDSGRNGFTVGTDDDSDLLNPLFHFQD